MKRMENEVIKHLEGTVIRIFTLSVDQREFHFHSDIEILMVLEGSLFLKDVRKRYVLKQGDIFILNKNELHKLCRTQGGNVLLILQFTPDFCSAYFPQIGRTRFTIKYVEESLMQEYWATIKRSMLEIMDCYGKKEKGFAIEMMALLNHLLFYMLKNDACIELDDKAVASEIRNAERLGSILEYIMDHYDTQVSLKEIAEREKLNMYYLSHFIKTNLGVAFQQYVNSLRLDKAEYLLMQTNLSEKDICTECGFSDCKYMERAFVEKFGHTPNEHRNCIPL